MFQYVIGRARWNGRRHLIVAAAAVTSSRLSVIAGALLSFPANEGKLLVRWLSGEPLSEHVIAIYFWLFLLGLGVGVALALQPLFHKGVVWRRLGVVMGVVALLWVFVMPEFWQLTPEVQGPFRDEGLVGEYYVPNKPAMVDIGFDNESGSTVNVKQVSVKAGTQVLCRLQGPTQVKPGESASYAAEIDQCRVPSSRTVIAFEALYSLEGSTEEFRTITNSSPFGLRSRR